MPQYKYPRSVKAAAKFLDVHAPKWADSVNLDLLDMDNGDRCILGQVLKSLVFGDNNFADGWTAAMDKFGWDTMKSDDNVFGWMASEDAWRNEVLSRQTQTIKVPRAVLEKLCLIVADGASDPVMRRVAEILQEAGYLATRSGYDVTL